MIKDVSDPVVDLFVNVNVELVGIASSVELRSKWDHSVQPVRSTLVPARGPEEEEEGGEK